MIDKLNEQMNLETLFFSSYQQMSALVQLPHALKLVPRPSCVAMLRKR